MECKKLQKAENTITRLQKSYEELNAYTTNLFDQVLNRQREMTAAMNEAKGHGIQVGFNVFRQLLLQLDLHFNIKALKALVTPQAVDSTIVVEVPEEEETTI